MMDELLLYAGAALACLPILYLAARVVSAAYFHEKGRFFDQLERKEERV